MDKIGMLVAVEIEAVKEQYGEPLRLEKHGSFTARIYEKDGRSIVVMESGAGEIAAAAATQILISIYGVQTVINFGLVGGLTPDMKQTKNCIVTKVVHYDFDCSGIDPVKPCQYAEYPDIYIPVDEKMTRRVMEIVPELMPVICASADKFVADPVKKAELHEKYGASICEMEAAAVALTCNRNGIPAVFVKIVSDGLFDEPGAFYEAKDYASKLCMKIVDEILGGGL